MSSHPFPINCLLNDNDRCNSTSKLNSTTGASFSFIVSVSNSFSKVDTSEHFELLCSALLFKGQRHTVAEGYTVGEEVRINYYFCV